MPIVSIMRYNCASVVPIGISFKHIVINKRMCAETKGIKCRLFHSYIYIYDLLANDHEGFNFTMLTILNPL